VKRRERASRLKVYIDRIEGDLAVIVLYDDDSIKFNLPVKYLPEGASGGDHFTLSFAVDKKSREEELRMIEELLRGDQDKSA
jgi:hypothetical protein